jgi:hypothetical protein
MNKRIIFLIIIILIIIGLVIVGYFRSKKQGKEIGVVEIPREGTPIPTPITDKKIPFQIKTTSTITTSVSRTYPVLFDQSFLYIDLDYPLLYIYDYQNQVIKYLNLEDETYREIVRVSNLKNAWLSEDKTKIIIETEKGFTLIDLKSDSIYDLSPFVKSFVFTPEIWLYINDGNNVSYLAKFDKGKTEKIRNLGILNPEFSLLKNSILIYEKNSPLFLLEFRNPSILKIFLEGQFFDVLTNKNKDLIFIVFKENERWQSKIIDLNKINKYSFPWATNKEKCSFDEVLVCAVQANFDLESWLMLDPTYDEKIVIYNPKTNKIKEVKLEEKFDFVKPKLTPLGIIAFDRFTMKFYVIKY